MMLITNKVFSTEQLGILREHDQIHYMGKHQFHDLLKLLVIHTVDMSFQLLFIEHKVC